MSVISNADYVHERVQSQVPAQRRLIRILLTVLEEWDNDEIANYALDALIEMKDQINEEYVDRDNTGEDNAHDNSVLQQKYRKKLVENYEAKPKSIRVAERKLLSDETNIEKMNLNSLRREKNFLISDKSRLLISNSSSAHFHSVPKCPFFPNQPSLISPDQELVKVCQKLLAENDFLKDEIIKVTRSAERVSLAAYDATLAKHKKDLALWEKQAKRRKQKLYYTGVKMLARIVNKKNYEKKILAFTKWRFLQPNVRR